MSRLDSFIARMQAQRDCLNFLKCAVDALPGPILEVGLGNGRTYDHLRDLFPGRDIHVFERQVAAHPDCIPPADRLFLGEARGSLGHAAHQLGPTAALIHTDLGTGDHAANMAMGQWLGPALDALAARGGYILANQALDVARWQRQPEPPGVPKDRYFLYRVL
ncbi:MAG TPA: class I SAM-dependent methyltransferase [Reyranella sp.]|nr:class I SAM-dependent methyltransferase [Reyranella sp.]